MANYYDSTLALAGVCQVAKLVQQLALNGEADATALETSLNSLLKTTPNTTLDVFGGELNNLKLGLTTLCEQLNGSEPELGRYWLSLLALAAKLNKTPEAKQELARRIQYLPTQLEHYHLLDEQMLSNFAGIYVDVISPLGRRIQVTGVTQYLQHLGTQNRIRAALLAGIRSAILWQQVGGTKWQLLFFRDKIAATAQHILSSL